ncbi:MAG: hypothetical protein AAFX44_14025 [Pseudomonadota bacterium]
MTNRTKANPIPDDLLSDEATRVRWDWVHQAISTAKSRNAEELHASESGEPPATAPRLIKN